MRRRLLLAAGISLATLAVVAWMAVGPLLSPHFKQNLLDVLGQHFGGNAELRTLDISFFPSPRVTGEGLVLRHRGRTDIPPLLAIERFSARAAWTGLLKRPRHVTEVEVYGLHLHIPSRKSGESLVPDSLKSDGPGDTSRASATARSEGPVIVDRIHAVDARLEIATKKPDKPPRTFEIHRLDLVAVALDRPMQFTATLTNPKPPGAIRANGAFGPWAAGEPGETPLRGDYTFSDADLGVFKGIGGSLTSEGVFSGILERISVKGKTSTPDFMVTSAGNPVSLSTVFVAIVDGTNGNTWLDPVDATFMKSALTARGGVVRVEGVRGREVSLDVAIHDARIDDLLRLAMKGEQAIMTGAARIETKLRIPPGDVDIIDKLELEGDFHIASARFADFDVQQSIAKLSRTGRGLPAAERGPSVVSDLAGRFVMRNGRIAFSKLTFTVPGASVHLAGAYTIRSEQLAFKGKLRLHASVSQTTTGFKRVLLKMVDPFFRKPGAGTEIPIRIEGHRSRPKFGLDMGAMMRRR